MFRNVVTEMSRDRNGQTESARPKSPVPMQKMFTCRIYIQNTILDFC